MPGQQLALGAICWLDQILRASLLGGLGIALVWLWIRLVPGTGPAARAWLWRLAYLKLVVALLWFAPVKIQVGSSEPLLQSPAFGLALRTTTRAGAPSSVEQDLSLRGGRSHSELASTVAEELPYSTATMVLSLLLLGIWILGLLRGLRAIRRADQHARRLLRRSEPVAEPSLLEDFEDLLALFRLRRRPELRWCSELSCPGVVRFDRPVVLLPAHLAATAKRHHLRMAVAHELAHLRRQDLRWSWLPRLARLLFFFHPLLRLAERGYLRSQEMAADELALALTGARPSRMAQSLMAVVERAAGRHPDPVLGLHRSGSFLDLRARIIMMARLRPRPPWRRVLFGLGLAVALLLTLPPWRPVYPAGQSPETAATSGSSVKTATSSLSRADALRARAVRGFDQLYGCYLRTR